VVDNNLVASIFNLLNIIRIKKCDTVNQDCNLCRTVVERVSGESAMGEGAFILNRQMLTVPI
jgi:hypothetical protein